MEENKEKLICEGCGEKVDKLYNFKAGEKFCYDCLWLAYDETDPTIRKERRQRNIKHCKEIQRMLKS